MYIEMLKEIQVLVLFSICLYVTVLCVCVSIRGIYPVCYKYFQDS